MPICVPCRDNHHSDCADMPRQRAQDAGEIVAVAPNTSMWCYCAHFPRGADAEPVPPDPPQPAGD